MTSATAEEFMHRVQLYTNSEFRHTDLESKILFYFYADLNTWCIKTVECRLSG